MAYEYIPSRRFSFYANTPLVRRRWFVFLMILVCVPVALTVALTGPIYAKQGGKVMLFSKESANKLAIGCALFIVFAIARLFLIK